MSPFVKAASSALADFPIINASIDDKNIVYHNYHDISIAVATPKGLVGSFFSFFFSSILFFLLFLLIACSSLFYSLLVPVLRNVENMSFADVEKQIALYGEQAKNGPSPLLPYPLSPLPHFSSH